MDYDFFFKCVCGVYANAHTRKLSSLADRWPLCAGMVQQGTSVLVVYPSRVHFMLHALTCKLRPECFSCVCSFVFNFFLGLVIASISQLDILQSVRDARVLSLVKIKSWLN